jgi:hypothetical protein
VTYELFTLPPFESQDFEPPLDAGIAKAVVTLRLGGIETFESCQGGEGHAFPEPTIRFHGDRSEGFRALAVALRAGLPVADLRRTWRVEEDEPTGPVWEMTFWKMMFAPDAATGQGQDGGGT